MDLLYRVLGFSRNKTLLRTAYRPQPIWWTCGAHRMAFSGCLRLSLAAHPSTGPHVMWGHMDCMCSREGHPKVLSRLWACSVRLLSACFSWNSARTFSRKAKGSCLPTLSCATTRYAACYKAQSEYRHTSAETVD